MENVNTSPVQAQPGGAPAVTPQQPRDAFDIKDLITDITFPSKGQFYGDKLPDGKAKIRGWRTSEIKLIANARRGSPNQLEQALDRVVDNCLILPSTMKSGDLLYTDGFYAMLMQRILTYNETYKTEIKCDSCGFKDPSVSIDLMKDLDVIWIKPEIREPIIVALPHQGADIGLRLLRRSDTIKISKYADQKMQQSPDLGDPAFTYRLALQIDTIDNEKVDLGKKVAWVDNLLAKDLVVLSDALEGAVSGVDPKIRHECRKCGETDEILLPLSLDFFRPRSA
jgi:hypothetical protein